jgi:hypothetical protein
MPMVGLWGVSIRSGRMCTVANEIRNVGRVMPSGLSL